jgi:hypothetical protein
MGLKQRHVVQKGFMAICNICIFYCTYDSIYNSDYTR